MPTLKYSASAMFIFFHKPEIKTKQVENSDVKINNLKYSYAIQIQMQIHIQIY